MWIVFGFLSLLFLLVSFFKKATSFILLSLSCVTLVQLNQYTIVNGWVNSKDWSALTDVVPTLSTVLIIYVICMIILNFISYIHNLRTEK